MSGVQAHSRELPMPTYRESTEFPASLGSFTLQSNDSVRFHVAPYLLQHVSGFFRDMFSLPTARAVGTTEILSVDLESSTLNDMVS
jgi:hypothetical protein